MKRIEEAGLSFDDVDKRRGEYNEHSVKQDAWRNLSTHPELIAEAKEAFDNTAEGRQQYFNFGEFDESQQQVGFLDFGGSFSIASAEELNPIQSSTNIYQKNIIDGLRASGKFNVFFEKVQELQLKGKPTSNNEDAISKYAPVSERLRADVLRLSNGSVDLREGEHSVSVSALWHSYMGHCLDYFIEDNQFNLSHDDLRMIPDIIENYDSIKMGTLNGGDTIEYTKRYGDVEYFVLEAIESKRNAIRGSMQKTIYVSDIKKKASDGSLHPTPSSKGFTRTEMITPISAYIKQNYAKEANRLQK